MKFTFTIINLFIVQLLLAQPLIPKVSFGTGGITTTNLANDASTYANATATQTDGKILVSGQGIIRIFSNGSVDNSFGNNGRVLGNYVVYGIAIQSDGSILAYVPLYDSSINIMRITANGSIDGNYGLNGTVNIKQQNINLSCSNITLQPDGKLLVVGQSDSANETCMFIARLLQTGVLDTSFNKTGSTNINASPGNNSASNAAIQSDGKIVLTGVTRVADSTNTKLAIIRLLPDGTRDNGFNNTGIFEYASPFSSGEYGQLVTIQPDDKIIVAGGSNAALLVVKLLPGGNPDSTFNENGLLITQIDQFNSPTVIHLIPNSKILITEGTANYQSATGWDYAAIQLDSTGLLDNSFNGTGTTIFPFPQNDHDAGSVVLPDGSFIIIGFGDSLRIINIVKFTSNGAIDKTFGNNGIQYVLAVGTDDVITKLLQEPDNKIVAAGTKSAGVFNQSLIGFTRYNTNGIIDSSYGTNGIFLYPADSGLYLQSAAMQQDGKVLATTTKYIYNSDYQIQNVYAGLFRINSNGTIDNSFAVAGNGLFQVSSIEANYGNNIALQSNGKILMAGYTQDTPSSQILIRVNTDGTPDNTFGTNGSITYPNLNGTSEGIAVQPDDKILLAMIVSNNDTVGYLSVARLLSNGTVDNTFGKGGQVIDTAFSLDFYQPLCMTTDAQGRIIVTGMLTDSTYYDTAIVVTRFNTNGTIDSSFNKTGHSILSTPSSPDAYYYNLTCGAITIYPDSSIYLTGIISGVPDSSQNGYIEQQFIAGLTKNGAKDSSVSADGTGWIIDNSTLNNFIYCNDMIVTADSTILTGGSIYNQNSEDFAVSAWKKITGKLYMFTGNGNWNNAANWSLSVVPPTTLTAGNAIIIEQGTCTLNITQYINAGASLIVNAGAKLAINKNLTISK